MKCLAKKILSFTLASFLLAAPILCCCFSDLAMAESINPETAIEVSLPPCHQQAEGFDSTDQNQADQPECECAKITSISVKKDFNLVRSSSLLEQIQKVVFSQPSVANLTHDLAGSFNQHSPPELQIASIPLYLQNSILRV